MSLQQYDLPPSGDTIDESLDVHEPRLNSLLLTSRDQAMQRTLTLCEGVAYAPTTVLLSGESGTGKEIAARFIHEMSERRDGPFVAINCAAVPGTLMESEFFGHEKGAFSGAIEPKKGLFELANGGTLLLDEISELPLELQPKLLRVLQERQLCRVGGTRFIEMNCRVIATTNHDLKTMVREGKFRQDLYYRVNVFPIEMKPLRDRLVDLADLSNVLLRRLADTMNRTMPILREDALARLMAYGFPGNVRELQNILERALILTTESVIRPEHIVFDHEHAKSLSSQTGLSQTESGIDFEGQTLAVIERQVILHTLQHLDGNRTRTSAALGISVRTLRNRLREYRVAGFSIARASVGCAA